MNTPLVFIKKHRMLFLILIAVIGAIFGLIKYNQIQQERINKEIINYCENNRWSRNDKESYHLRQINGIPKSTHVEGGEYDDYHDTTCIDYLYLKPNVKKSSGGICHDENSIYYYKTKSYQTFNSIDDCLESGGRKPYN